MMRRRLNRAGCRIGALVLLAVALDSALCSAAAEPAQVAAAVAAEPAAQTLTASAYVARAPRQALGPMVFFGKTLLRLPQLLRPARAAWNIVTAPLGIFFPIDTVFDLTTVPGDLWAPVAFVGNTLKDSPELLGPVEALGSLALAANAACRAAAPPADLQPPEALAPLE